MASIYIADPTEINMLATDGYSFVSATRRKLCWPRKRGQNLGAAGAFNFFLRCGFKVSIVSRRHLDKLSAGDILVVDIPEQYTGDISPFLNGPWHVLFTGDLSLLASVFQLKNVSLQGSSSPYNSYCIRVGSGNVLLQPENWGIYVFDRSTESDASQYLSCFDVSGDRLDPDKALLKEVSRTSLIVARNDGERSISYVNGFVFSALQAWLQGQEDLNHWLSWHSRQHWLDDYVQALFFVLSEYTKLPFGMCDRVDLGTTICLRHDNDSSTDTSFLEVEKKYAVPATYAVLDDNNLKDWQEYAQKWDDHEYALHYTTVKDSFFGRVIGRLLRLFGVNKAPVQKKGKDVLKSGNLSDQIDAVKKNLGEVKTLHRHFAYLPYPELIDELEYAYAKHPSLLGSLSFFRGRLLRWGADELDGMVSFTNSWPDVQHPYWMVFKVANAAERGRILPGWEGSLAMEAEPDFFSQLVSVRHSFLPNKFMTFCLHPAHAKSDLFVAGGTAKWLEQYILRGKKLGLSFERYDCYLEKLNQALQDQNSGGKDLQIEKNKIHCVKCGQDNPLPSSLQTLAQCESCGQEYTIKNRVTVWKDSGGLALHGPLHRFQAALREKSIRKIIEVLVRYTGVAWGLVSAKIVQTFTKRQLQRQSELVEQQYQLLLNPDNELTSFWRNRYIDKLDLVDGANVLDFGCGKGRNVAHLTNCGFQVSALDVAAHPYWENFPQVHFDVVPMGNTILPYENESMDLIFTDLVLSFFDRSELEVLFKEFARVLKRGGKCLFIEPNRMSYAAKVNRKYYSKYPETLETVENIAEADFKKIESWYEGYYAKSFCMLKNLYWFAKHEEAGTWMIADNRDESLPTERRGMWVLQLEKK